MSRNVRAGAVGAAAVVVAAVTGGFLAMHAHAAAQNTTAASATVTATLKHRAGATGSGKLTGKLTSTSATAGKLAWKVTFTGLKSPATGVQIRLGTKVLAHLCNSCASGAHKTTALRGAAFKAVSTNKATVTVSTKKFATGQISGRLKVAASSGGGGGGVGTIAVTAATIAAGKKAAAQFSCQSCHTIDGTKSVGPTWKGLYNSTVHLKTGGTTKATAAYLFGIITDPSTANVEGYDSGVMAEVIAPGEVSDAQARDIVAYIESLK